MTHPSGWPPASGSAELDTFASLSVGPQRRPFLHRPRMLTGCPQPQLSEVLPASASGTLMGNRRK